MKRIAKKSLIATALFGVVFSFSQAAFAEDAFVAQAKQTIAAATAPQTVWDGPTSGPQLQKDKSVIFIASDMKNGGVLGVLDGMKQAAAVAGWKLDVLDGAGSVSNQLASLNQAIAKKPDAIVIGGWNPNVARNPLKKAHEQNITLIAWHASPQPGPIDQYNVFYNVTSDSDQIAKLSALLAVAKSEGKAQVVILTDSLYEIALRKANVMKETIEQCSGCKVLEFVDTPLADTSSRMPGLTFSTLQKYQDNFQYTLAINDLYFDFMAPSLRSAGIKGNAAPYNISAGDGSVTAYQRIRAGEHQVATVPEPLNLHGWQLVDELNRAFSGEKPSGYVTPVHLVTKENIAYDGGDKNNYDPQNGYQDAYRNIWGVK
ncbi:substrate-binding domain-containing protein [Testudinibacter aquarius]|uniref:Monosaccharide ABC transporter substrate-binding protein (CUT2 family) n=1 Tax=Testudinibacter aquarius TaxID=1524974 RepID=A0A4R3Y5W2_9PAST|nr:substrate-binding domain-containing protein [Testudinibacter aquarius]KAE9526351.1 sugar ABC transporter substrate-binding protein [Testudinibacter aquarius]TCV87170.1 monosaccharide ABC transporter substrate-binding protein (CUT2 family) [Testudinibacter aquarius]TNG92464.1 substrate-binding domain-containing protein [Testudinibacter aquarius]